MNNKLNDDLQILRFDPYKVVRNNDSVYLYTINSSGIFEVDERTLRLLDCEGKSIAEAKSILSDDFKDEELDAMLDEMKEIRFLNFGVEHKKEEIAINISALTLMVVQECNMRCIYCYGESGEYKNRGVMSREIAFRAVDFLIKNSLADNLHIAFLGGEPLLNFNLIKEIVEYCRYKENKTSKKFSFTITTNGTLITEEIEHYLCENHIVCQVSIDGIKEKHDKNRYFANGKGSYDSVIKNTITMREKNLVTARATATRNNMDYQEIFDHLDGLKFKAIPIAVAQNMINEEEYNCFVLMYKEYIKYFEKLVKQGEYARARKMTDVINALEKFEYGSVRRSGCGAAKFQYAVDINGDLFPCHRFVGERTFCLGNIEDGGESSSFLKKIGIDNRDKCKKCWAQNLCLGGCPHENFSVTGSVNIPGTRNCNFSQMVYEQLLNIYINLSEKDKKVFQDL